jgi:hypothetical protein
VSLLDSDQYGEERLEHLQTEDTVTTFKELKRGDIVWASDRKERVERAEGSGLAGRGRTVSVHIGQRAEVVDG